MRVLCFFFFFSSRRRHTRSLRDWSSDVCSSDLGDRDGDLACERILRQEVEKDLEQAAVGGAIDRRAHHYDPRIEHGLNGISYLSILAPSQQRVGWQLGEIDQTRGAGGLPFERRERQREQGAGVRYRLGAAG